MSVQDKYLRWHLAVISLSLSLIVFLIQQSSTSSMVIQEEKTSFTVIIIQLMLASCYSDILVTG